MYTCMHVHCALLHALTAGPALPCTTPARTREIPYATNKQGTTYVLPLLSPLCVSLPQPDPALPCPASACMDWTTTLLQCDLNFLSLPPTFQVLSTRPSSRPLRLAQAACRRMQWARPAPAPAPADPTLIQTAMPLCLLLFHERFLQGQGLQICSLQ